LRGPRECAGGEARAAGGCGRRGVRECGQWARRGACCRERHPSRGRRCAGGGAERQHDAADARPPRYVDRSHECILREWAADSGDLASARAERARVAGGCGRRGVRECGQWARRGAWCRQRHPSRGRRCACGGAPRQHDAANARPQWYVDRSHACILREWAAAPGDLASARAERARAAGGCGRRGERECGQ
jgi:hypothetical protein